MNLARHEVFLEVEPRRFHPYDHIFMFLCYDNELPEDNSSITKSINESHEMCVHFNGVEIYNIATKLFNNDVISKECQQLQNAIITIFGLKNFMKRM